MKPRPERLILFEIVGKPIENRVEHTAVLAGLDHVDEDYREGSRLHAHSLSQGLPLLHTGRDLFERFSKAFVFGKLGGEVKSLDERNTGIDQGRKLASKNRKGLRRCFVGFTRFGCDLRSRLDPFGNQLAADELTSCVLRVDPLYDTLADLATIEAASFVLPGGYDCRHMPCLVQVLGDTG